MALEQLTRTVDFVQDATPSASDANDGETYLDTSLTPPRLKIFDASAGSFIEPSGAALTRISASYDLQTAKLVQKQSILNAFDIEINAFGTGALQLSSDKIFGAEIGSESQGDKSRFHEDFNVSHFGSLVNGFVDLGNLTGNSGFRGLDTHVIGSDSRDKVTPTSFIAVSDTPVRMYEFLCDSGGSSPFTSQGLDNTSVLNTTDISTDVGTPEDIVQDLLQDKVAVLDSANNKLFEFDNITDSTANSSFDISGQTTSPRAIAFDKQTEGRFYIGDANGKIYAYGSSGFSIGNLNFVGSVDFSSEVGFNGNAAINGLEFGDLGRHMYISSGGETSLLHYRLGEVTPTYE